MARHRSPEGSRPRPSIHRSRGAHRRPGPALAAGRRALLATVAAGAVTTGVQAVTPATAVAGAQAPDRASITSPLETPTLRSGSEGDVVGELQRVLNAWYPSRVPLAEDGVFGPATEAAVLHLQERADIVVDGIVGPQTRGVLGIPGTTAVAPDSGQIPDQQARDEEPDPEAGDDKTDETDEADETEETAEPDDPDEHDKSDDEPPVSPDASPADVVKPASGRFTSGFGARWGSTHRGIDIANDIGTPIHATTGGVVVESGPASGFGMWVRVQHHDGDVSVYGHINESLVTEGQQVATGEQIATMGNRGRSTGPHLHFEIWEDGKDKIDPRGWLQEHGVHL